MKWYIMIMALILSACNSSTDNNISSKKLNYARDPERFEHSIYVRTDVNPEYFRTSPATPSYARHSEETRFSESTQRAIWTCTCMPFDTIKVFAIFRNIALAYVCDNSVEPYCRDNDFVVIRKQWDLPLYNGKIIHLSSDECFEWCSQYISDNELNILIPFVRILPEKAVTYEYEASQWFTTDKEEKEREIKLNKIATEDDLKKWRKKDTVDKYKNCYMCFENEEDETIKQTGYKYCKYMELSERGYKGYENYVVDVDPISAMKKYPEMFKIHFSCEHYFY